MLSYPSPPAFHEVVQNQPIRIRLDNLPPGKKWRQVKGFLSQFIPWDHVINIRMLPLMPSITPHFMLIQSCIVTLNQNTDWRDLLMRINGIQWEYHTLMAIVLLNFFPANHAGMLGVPGGSGYTTSDPPRSERPLTLGPKGGSSHEEMKRGSHNEFGSLNAQLITDLMSNMSFLNPVASYKRRQVQIFNENSFRRQMSERNMNQLLLSNFPPCLHWDEVMKTTKGLTSDAASNEQNDNSDVILDESGRNYEGPIAGAFEGGKFASLLQRHVLQDENNEIVPDLTILTSHPEKFGKLKWTILKDFLKLKCPKLLEMDQMSRGAALSNTREFYVGVYEKSESYVEIILLHKDEPDVIVESSLGPKEESEFKIKERNLKRFKVRATQFEAVVGFHSKELCDLCFKEINNEEYMLGYKLKVERLEKID